MRNKELSKSHLLKLCQFADSALPIGGFAFSNGLESAIQLGIVQDGSTLKKFIQVALKQSANMDGIFVNHAHHLSEKDDVCGLINLTSEYISRRVGAEQQLMATRIGTKLATLFSEICSSTKLDALVTQCQQEKIDLVHPVIHGVILQDIGASREESFSVYQYGTASMMLSAAIRLMRIDHYETQRILFEVNQDVADQYADISEMSIAEVCSFAPVYDCLISHHVSAYVRMFMS